jgi:dsDNA-binding SOS-regulon protein
MSTTPVTSAMFKTVIVGPDGNHYDSKAEAMDAMRKPAVKAALFEATGKNKELTDWLVENEEHVQVAFETGTIRRVTKSDHNKLAKAIEALKEIQDNSKIAFLQENAGAILDSFRWPTVKRMDEQEKATAARNTLVAASEGNEELANWIIANKDAVLEAYNAGKIKREVSPKATEALAAYQAKRAAEALAAATAAGPEALAEYNAKLAERAAEKAAKA